MLGAALLAGLAWNLAHAAEVRGLHLATGPTGTRAEIALDASVRYTLLSLSNPDRLVVDLPASALGRNVRLPAPSGVVRAIRTGQPADGTLRLVFDLAQPVAALNPRLEPAVDGPRLVVEWPGDGETTTPATATAAAAAVPAQASVHAATTVSDAGAVAASNAATSRLITEIIADAAPVPTAPAAAASPPPPVTPPVARTEPPAPAASNSSAPLQAPIRSTSPLRPLVIAIDPGHGGQDPGAIGPSGKREKDITLAIARELARQINATPGLKAYLTRDTDVFLPLHRRTQLARQARADMFISIHADAAENRSARGSSVYVLSLKGASSQRARWLADKENAADLIGGVKVKHADATLTSVLIDLTQSGQMRASEDAAQQVLGGLARVGRNHKPRIERANFAVLRTSDMPAMLVETAFISNPDEERLLSDAAHQRRLAAAVLDGINGYFTRQPPPGTLFAARAQQLQATASASAGAAGAP
ncbi:MAG TPA: N-acetylmuramoyl-L-alanine amidase [Lysobacter sp.]|nr:N-acetylmuramoyl-L-alanine amidase [Lysobacter sp.]